MWRCHPRHFASLRASNICFASHLISCMHTIESCRLITCRPFDRQDVMFPELKDTTLSPGGALVLALEAPPVLTSPRLPPSSGGLQLPGETGRTASPFAFLGRDITPRGCHSHRAAAPQSRSFQPSGPSRYAHAEQSAVVARVPASPPRTPALGCCVSSCPSGDHA